MHNLTFFSFIGFLKPREISLLTSKLSNSILLNKQVKMPSLREIFFSISKKGVIPFRSINCRKMWQENHNLTNAARLALQSKDSISSNFSLKENNFIEEEVLDSNLIVQRNPYVANLSYLKKYTHKYNIILKHHFLELFLKKINEFKYIFKKFLTQPLLAPLGYGLPIQITPNIKNVINLLNIKILQVLVFFKEFFLMEQIFIKNNWLTKDLGSYSNFYMLQTSFLKGEEKVLTVSQKRFFKFSTIQDFGPIFLKYLSPIYVAPPFFLTITNSSWYLQHDTEVTCQTKLKKGKSYLKFFSVLGRVGPRHRSNQGVSFVPLDYVRDFYNRKDWQAPLSLRAYKCSVSQFHTLFHFSYSLGPQRGPFWQLPLNCLKDGNVNASWKYTNTPLKLNVTTFFFQFKNLLAYLVLCFKKILNKLLWKYSKKYTKNITYMDYLQKSKSFIEKMDFFYTFDIFV